MDDIDKQPREQGIRGWAITFAAIIWFFVVNYVIRSAECMQYRNSCDANGIFGIIFICTVMIVPLYFFTTFLSEVINDRRYYKRLKLKKKN